MGSTSIYAVIQADPVVWSPGEEQAASAFIGVALWLAFDVLFSVYRSFKRKRGLYFWSMFLGMFFIIIKCIGLIVKYFTHQSEENRLWPLSTLFMLSAWSVFPMCQLLVLYSRLHLVNEIPWVRKVILILIITAEIVAVIPVWATNWLAYNPNPATTKAWSPRSAVVERYNQIVFTVAEISLSGTYVLSLYKILQGRMNVRQRRVMTDLIYVNVLVVAIDIVAITLYFLNRDGISHPVQAFSYALKMKLEFLVLNQLMVVAARGVQKSRWEAKRYLDHGEKQFPSQDLANDSGASQNQVSQGGESMPLDEFLENVKLDENQITRPQTLALPAQVYDARRSSNLTALATPGISQTQPPVSPTSPARHSSALFTAYDDGRGVSPLEESETSRTTSTSPPLKGPAPPPRAPPPRSPPAHNSNRLFSVFENHGPRARHKRSPNIPQSRFNPFPTPGLDRDRGTDEYGEEEISLDMWDRRGGAVRLHAPWLESRTISTRAEGGPV